MDMEELILLTYTLTSKKKDMKSTKTLLFSFVAVGLVFLTSSCTKDGDYQLYHVQQTLMSQDFTDPSTIVNGSATGINDNTKWTTIAQQGTKNWTNSAYGGNGYGEFTSYQSNQALNVAWLIAPTQVFTEGQNVTLAFQTAEAYLKSLDNSIELMVSTDYDGTNFNASSWVAVPANFPTPDSEKYAFINSGNIDLSRFKGNVTFAFKVKGSGTNSSLGATYQIDNIRLFY